MGIQRIKNSLRPSWLFWAGLALVLCAGVWLRVHQIDNRPLHNDEGVNFFFFEGVRRAGYYKYSHENYHGPSYFYLSTLLTAPELLGVSELGVRSSAILVGVLTILLPLLLLRSQGRRFVLISAALIAASSSLTYYSRYAIHETLFLFAGAWLGVSLYLWWENGSVRQLYAAGAAGALLIATKETFIITLFSLFCAFLALGGYRCTCQRVRAQWAHLLQALLLMALIVVLFFTGGLQWPAGLREMLAAVPQWIGRNTSDTGHFKPFWYYINMLIGPELLNTLRRLFDPALGQGLRVREGAEPQLAFALIIPLLYLACSAKQALRGLAARDAAFFRFSAVWALSACLVYSFVRYKTPWLVINISFPALLCLAWSTARLFDYPAYGRLLGGTVCALLLLIAGQRVWRYNFEIPYGGANPYSYVHTREGMLELVRDIEAYRQAHPRARVLVGVQGYWPLPYYLRDVATVGYEHTTEPGKRADDYDILILDSTVTWHDPAWLRKYYRLSDVQESNTYFRRQEAAGAGRGK